MPAKADTWIRHQAIENRMIEPFESEQVREGVISYGVSSYGYDIRVSDEFKIFNPVNTTIVDPKSFDARNFSDFKGPVCLIPPHSFVLASSAERFKIPRDVMVICVGKSSYARAGIFVNVTPFEPEWEGNATIQIFNCTPLPAKIYAHEGIAQLLFLSADSVCQTSYKDRRGKYQNQAGIALPRV